MITPSQRSSREIPLLLLALILVGGVCAPLWFWLQHPTVQIDPGVDLLSAARKLRALAASDWRERWRFRP
ncbi:MAG: hypothetical protein ACJ8F7_08740 [Gemmataceae bacterium]